MQNSDPDTAVYIWSFQHQGWWRPGERSYTADLREAGQYSLERAREICERANVRAIQEAIVPVNTMWAQYGLPAGLPGVPE